VQRSLNVINKKIQKAVMKSKLLNRESGIYKDINLQGGFK